MKLGDLEFKTEDAQADLSISYKGEALLVEMISIEAANRLLSERLEKAPLAGTRDSLNANPWGRDWSEAIQTTYHTHTGRVVCIERLSRSED